MNRLQAEIEQAFDGASITDLDSKLKQVYRHLETGSVRVAEKQDGQWVVNEWVRKAILLSFSKFPPVLMNDGVTHYLDRIPPRFRDATQEEFARLGTRVTPGSVVRSGAYLGRDTVIMPGFINVGAWVGDGTMVDTWATVGSCAQIGKHVHLSGGVGIGGVLEPMQATPTIIEDHCFIGARSEIVEGVIVGTGAVIGMGVFIGQSTPIYDRASGEITYGRVPDYSVVVGGSLPRGDYNLNAAIIVKTVDERTRAKTGVTELLRGLS
ncbi:MAG: 2,3,4,5-tetrahydropyridine-2,6-dicarboxylate N-succinyltransferase [Pseudomonadales bacterium]|nr:2,3,4,5-tetrahydropyridine-2,6-dicarboxylate N-succinyltransferase [Pseudomonadales bacterium]